MSLLSFSPSQTTSRLISELPERGQDVIRSRYGIGDSPESETLESIGGRYGITRERVRQIEAAALEKMRTSETVASEQGAFAKLEELFHDLGVVLPEHLFLEHVTDDRLSQNHVFLLLELGDRFQRDSETKHLHTRWHVDSRVARAVSEALDQLHNRISHDDLVSEGEIINMFVSHIDELPGNHRHHMENEESVRRWLEISKHIDRNPLGEWGLANSPNIRLKGVRDYAYLVIRKHGSPLHFREVTEKIRDLFGKDAHVATTHNELIKGDRFVLVGRGLYGLKEWGYMTGVVREVIEKILEKHGPLTKQEVIDKVLKERYVKENTVVVNLQNEEHFRRTPEGRYTLA